MEKKLASWNRFWFSPRDPTLLGLIRILCGAVTTYTIFAYTFMLQDFMGKDSWYDLSLRREVTRSKPNEISPLSGREYVSASPSTDMEKAYFENYKAKWNTPPPPPFPRDKKEADDLDDYKSQSGYDLRYYGLIPPRTKEESDYVKEYSNHPSNFMRRPPPAYPADAKEKKKIYDYMARQGGLDPRLVYSIGQPAWSLWFHVTDPDAMSILHALVLLVSFLFTIGFCTRLTSALTWFSSLWYIHRNTVVLFGVDTMMVILLLYLMIGSSGRALSVDRLIARWWSKAKPRMVNRWRGLFGRPALTPAELQPAAYSPVPVATVSANFALRLLQVHLCIIYLVSGVSKLQGAAWWNGTAVWGTIANFEFAPMTLEIFGFQVYTEFLRWLGGNTLLLSTFLNSACLFTLAFEIGYAFLVWRPSTRWVVLAGAITLHGFIGLLMGLKTFSLMMLIMNMAFLSRSEVDKILRVITRPFTRATQTPKEAISATTEPAPALTR